MNYFLCYKADNVFAYRADSGKDLLRDYKLYNFVPVYDKWCLYCDKKDVKMRCQGCSAVFFCDKECQKKAWPIHKKHCGRKLFAICIACGNPNCETLFSCDSCPVKYCCQDCKRIVHSQHKEFDCEYFSKTFGN